MTLGAAVPVQRIGIAIVEHAGLVLVGRRGSHQSFAGYDEFPGGKCEGQESSAACAERECREETGLSVSARECLLQIRVPKTAASNGRAAVLSLDFWRCTLACGPETARVDMVQSHPVPASPFQWTSLSQLAERSFPPANERLLEILRDAVRFPISGESSTLGCSAAVDHPDSKR